MIRDKVIRTCGHAAQYACKELPKTLKATVGTILVKGCERCICLNRGKKHLVILCLLIGHFDLGVSENRIP